MEQLTKNLQLLLEISATIRLPYNWVISRLPAQCMISKRVKWQTVFRTTEWVLFCYFSLSFISLDLQHRLVTLIWTLIIPDITQNSSNSCSGPVTCISFLNSSPYVEFGEKSTLRFNPSPSLSPFATDDRKQLQCLNIVLTNMDIFGIQLMRLKF